MKKKEKLAKLEYELAQVKSELEQSRREHYRGTSQGQFGFGPRHYVIEKGNYRWLD